MLKSLAKLFSGNIAVQGIAFSLMPVVTRIYGPEQLGVYQFITTVALVISPFVHFSLAQALIKEKDDVVYKEILSAACALSLISSVVFAMSFSLLTVAPFVNVELGLNHVVLFFFLSLTTAINTFARTLHIRSGAYGMYAAQGVITSSTGNCGKILLGVLSPSSLSLMFGLIIGNVSAILYTTRGRIARMGKVPSLKNLSSVFVRLKGFTVHLSISQFISIFVSWHLIFFSPLIAPSSEVGMLALAVMVVKTPSFPFLASIANYAYSEAAKAKNKKEKYSSLLIKLSSLGLLGAVAILAVLMAYGSSLFVIVFGREWEDAAKYALYLAIPLISEFSLSPVYRCWANLHNKQSQLVVVDIIFAIAILFLCFFAYQYNFTLSEFVLASSIVVFISHISKFFKLYHAQKGQLYPCA